MIEASPHTRPDPRRCEGAELFPLLPLAGAAIECPTRAPPCVVRPPALGESCRQPRQEIRSNFYRWLVKFSVARPHATASGNRDVLHRRLVKFHLIGLRDVLSPEYCPCFFDVFSESPILTVLPPIVIVTWRVRGFAKIPRVFWDVRLGAWALEPRGHLAGP